MKTCFLYRYESTLQGTFGHFVYPWDMFSVATVECPWLRNLTYVSCIPTGEYECVAEWSDKFKKRLYEVKNVPDRSKILIHPGNVGGANWTLKSEYVEHKLEWKTDLQGCIALGLTTGTLYNQNAVLFSESAFLRFEQLMDWKPFKLTIAEIR